MPKNDWIKIIPKKKRSNIRDLDLSNQKLEDELDLSDFVNLKKLEIDGNPAINVDLVNLPANLQKFSYDQTELAKLLEPYQGDWKAYKIQELQKRCENSKERIRSMIEESQKDIWSFLL